MVGDQSHDLAALVNSTSYRRALEWQVQQGLKIVPMDPKLALALALKAVVASGRTIADLAQMLDVFPMAFNKFVMAKLGKFTGDDEEEYPPGEAPAKSDRPKTLQVLGYPESFLVAHLCEFALASVSPAEVEEYAKRYRIPKAKKYAKEVLRLFQQANSTAKE
jgi:hypothetical protein